MKNNPQALADLFPEQFLFGVATASYQIEGAVNEHGRGASIWDTFSHTKGCVVNNDNGDIACDHYNRWQSDLDLIESLGVKAYRFSIAWSRIFPTGSGEVNQAGLDFYEKLIDGCISRGIAPYATLYHWDLPQTLQDAGGWTNRETASAFAQYARLIADKFGDRLQTLVTFNEPWCSAYLGHLYGIHAPGLKNRDAAMCVVHNQNLAHGMAVQQIRAARPELPVGLVLNAHSVYPETAQDADAVQRHRAFHNGVFFDPVFAGSYPQLFLDACADSLPSGWQDDLATINQPLDFWGLNYYTPARVRDNPDSPFPGTLASEPKDGCEVTDIGWEINPQAFYDLLLDLKKQYVLPPCYITENGACFNDGVVDGRVADQRRIDYVSGHLQAVAKAIEAGVDVRGYFLWSLLDNFEWAEGYTMRFGAVHVDYKSQVRTVKDSGHWYAKLGRLHSLQ